MNRINLAQEGSQEIVLGTQDIKIMTLQVKLTCKIASLGVQNKTLRQIRIQTYTLKQPQNKNKVKKLIPQIQSCMVK